MAGLVEGFLNGVDTFLAWFSASAKQTTESYCDLQTADSPTVLVANDGSLVSIIKIIGVNQLVGQEEYERIHAGLQQALGSTLRQKGYSVQVHFSYNRDDTEELLEENYASSRQTADRLQLDVDDLIGERIKHMTSFCAAEEVHIVLYTKPTILAGDQYKRATNDKAKMLKDSSMPAFKYTQNLVAALPELRDAHDSFARSTLGSLKELGVFAELLSIHEAGYEIRRSIDPGYTSKEWRPILPGDRYSIKLAKKTSGDIADLTWPSFSNQLFPRDAYNVDLKTCMVGDRIYSNVYIDLFPKQVQAFVALLSRLLDSEMPWRMSFMLDGAGMEALRIKRMFTSILAFSSAQNRLINDAVNVLDYIETQTDDKVIKLRVIASTWAPEGQEKLLRSRASLLARAIQSWGSCDVSEMCGDAFEGTVGSMLGVTMEPAATVTVASLSSALYMLPVYRAASPWRAGSMMLRTPDGKPWPYQPGSPLQTTWIDIIYARPGSGKSVLSNAINFALCLQGGLERLPRIAVIDIGPSSAGLVSLIKEALPADQSYLAAYHRLQMTPEYSINPFDTHLGCRYPFPQERAFLVNFVTLLVTPVGAQSPYDGVADMVGMVVDEAYKGLADDGNPNIYTEGIDEELDALIEQIGFVADEKTTWWEVTDALFSAGFERQAMFAQRKAMPLVGDLTSVARIPAVVDLYGKITIPTGESLINAFVRMISGAVREYPILSRYTRFDIGSSKIVSLDLDEVAKSGGDAADRQTAVMYMLARYVLAKDFYINKENLSGLNDSYKDHHMKIVSEIREDQKRLVMDEFHRTSKAQAVRDQVIVDMREGRKWRVQIALISQSLDDFSKNMVDFATSIFIMDAGPEQSIRKTKEVFGLSATAVSALRNYVRGPSAKGANFLAQFATKDQMTTHLLTVTIGPVELWAFSTTAEDVKIRNALYQYIGPQQARALLARIFPSGSASKYVAMKMEAKKQESGMVSSDEQLGVIDSVIKIIMDEYKKDPEFKVLPA